jgi:hypothetical protein
MNALKGLESKLKVPAEKWVKLGVLMVIKLTHRKCFRVERKPKT